MPHDALPHLLFERNLEEERSIKSYMEWQSPGERLTHCEKVASETVLGRRMDAWDVYTDKARWWVVTQPTNLYRQDLFPSLDYTISFHVGVTTRMMSIRTPGVPIMEKALLLVPWRKWEQAAESLDEAEEAEDFQAVGMRCRECLIAFVKKFGKPEMVPAGKEGPKASDVVAWSELIADYLAYGASAEHVRRYLKATSKNAWGLVNWLTHSQHATHADGGMAIEVTQHVLSVFGTALFRKLRGIPEQCPECGSYRIGLKTHPEGADDSEPLPACQQCEWIQRIG